MVSQAAGSHTASHVHGIPETVIHHRPAVRPVIATQPMPERRGALSPGGDVLRIQAPLPVTVRWQKTAAGFRIPEENEILFRTCEMARGGT